MPIFCSKCGKENIDTAKFCNNCANTLQTSTPSGSSQTGNRGELKSKEWDLIAGKVEFEPDLIVKYSDVPSILKTISSAKICVRCEEIYPLEACSNCGSNNFIAGFTTEGTTGLFCFKCKTGYSSWTCPNCKTLNPISNSLALEKKKGGCFIATASCGTENHPDVVILRYYRDTILSQSTLGQYFIKLYYIISPPIAGVISRSIILRKIFRKGLIYPIASLCRNLLSNIQKS